MASFLVGVFNLCFMCAAEFILFFLTFDKPLSLKYDCSLLSNMTFAKRTKIISLLLLVIPLNVLYNLHRSQNSLHFLQEL